MTINMDEISKMLGAATPGPWECDERVGCISVHPKQNVNCICDVVDQVASWDGFMKDGRWNVKESDAANARLIAAAPTIIKELVERVRKLENALDLVEWSAPECLQEPEGRCGWCLNKEESGRMDDCPVGNAKEAT